ncbi:MAG: hypothetical protein AAB340_01440 [Patescibacteria group bacterium]
MTNQTYQRIKKEIKQELLEEFVLPILKNLRDAEGDYKKEFVREILKAAKEKPTHFFTDSKSFLKELRRK